MFPQARENGLLVQDVGDELVIYDQKRHRAHRLNAAAARIWRRCDGRTGVDELSAVLEEAGLPAKGDLVWLALDRLEKADLLREPVVRPESAKEISRRKVVRGLGLAGLAFLLPAVTSITAPIPAMAQYGSGGGGNGGGGCKAIFCCICKGKNPEEPTRACTRNDNGDTEETTSSGKCLRPNGTRGGACQTQDCTRTATWICDDKEDPPIFKWRQVGLTDDCSSD